VIVSVREKKRTNRATTVASDGRGRHRDDQAADPEAASHRIWRDAGRPVTT
jgi:hypothetical protein